MPRFYPIVTCVVAVIGAAFPASGDVTPVSFNRDVRPILSDKCFFCHGPDPAERKADLRLDLREDALEAEAFVPGDPEASELVARITTPDPDDLMPPPDSHKDLDADEIAILVRWIAEGAPYERPWAYVPPVRHPVPAPARDDWSVNWIDRFVLARLEAEGLEPSPDADPVTLARRLHFDLTGLPPTPEAVARFASVPFEESVGALLADPAFGERMATYWLDLVRFADTVGYHGDQDHSISPYRDYVIDAFNRNLPFDRFTREQLAGDLLPDPTIDQKIASGYNRLLQTSHEGGVQPKEYLAIYAADRVRNVSSVWMGATMGCAQCHDHKYDPFTMRDFYSLAAFFADIDETDHFKVGTNALPTKRPPEIDVLDVHQRARIAELESRLATTTEAGDRRAIEDEIASIRKDTRRTMISVSVEPRTMRVLPRGNWLDDSGEIVEPAVPAFLGAAASDEGPRATRLDLANWLTDPAGGAGGLTARVIANRLWFLFFGEGLARNLDDFGGQGEPPRVHPELLDNLAVEFHESGWDVKHLVRLIVSSRTYRQESLAPEKLRRRDPDNRLLARQGRFRLPAEAVRDTALAVSGLLVREIGGPSTKPYQPAGYYRHLNFPPRRYEHHEGERQWRRGVYVHWQRQFLHPMLKAFDAPSREECTAKRTRSNTPTAAMVLLNDPTFVEAARAFAARILREAGPGGGERLDHAFRLALSRPPDSTELDVLDDLFRVAEAEFRDAPERARELVAVGQAPVEESIDPVELATWTTVCRALLNLGETFTRN